MFQCHCPQNQFDGGGRLKYQIVMPTKGEPRYDTCWRKSRIAARILLREEAGRLTPRDVALGHKLAADPGVTPRLIDQALYGFSGRAYRVAVARRKKA
jgi:hypothetical protein